MSQDDLTWSRRFVAYCQAERQLPPFITRAASVDPFTGAKIPEIQVKPQLIEFEAQPITQAAAMPAAVQEFAEAPPNSLPIADLTHGLGHLSALP
eukprot:196392-Amphidinium_carterae.1